MLWPVNGQVVIDYSMDATTYFPTLDQYKYNDALMLGCESGEPVQAAANGQVVPSAKMLRQELPWSWISETAIRQPMDS